MRHTVPSVNVTNGISFLTDYFHTFTILIIACFFTIKAFTIPEIGSIGHLYDLVAAATKAHPVAGNEAGSYLTMTSKGVHSHRVCRNDSRSLTEWTTGHLFRYSTYTCQFWTCDCGNSLLISQIAADAIQMDTSFFVKAFAASPAAVVPGYIIGGIAYFAVPWCLGTLMSFVAVGLENDPRFPTYPRVSHHH